MNFDQRHHAVSRLCRFVVLAFFLVISSAHAQERISTNTVGGPGGGAFNFDCPPNTYMTGLRARHGAWIDAVAAECSSFNTSTQRLESGAVSRNFGGNGGGVGAMHCARPRGVVTGLEIIPADNPDRTIGHIIINCGDLFEPSTFANKAGGSADYLGQATSHRRSIVKCPPNFVAVGILGKHGVYVDRLGLRCGKKPFTLGMPQRAP